MMTTDKTFPKKLESKADYPNQLTNLKDAHDGKFLHLAVSASFAISKEKPS